MTQTLQEKLDEIQELVDQGKHPPYWKNPATGAEFYFKPRVELPQWDPNDPNPDPLANAADIQELARLEEEERTAWRKWQILGEPADRLKWLDARDRHEFHKEKIRREKENAMTRAALREVKLTELELRAELEEKRWQAIWAKKEFEMKEELFYENAPFGMRIKDPGSSWLKPNLDRSPSQREIRAVKVRKHEDANPSPSYSPSPSAEPYSESPSASPSPSAPDDIVTNEDRKLWWEQDLMERLKPIFNPSDLIEPITRTSTKKSQTIGTFVVNVYLWIRNLLQNRSIL